MLSLNIESWYPAKIRSEWKGDFANRIGFCSSEIARISGTRKMEFPIPLVIKTADFNIDCYLVRNADAMSYQ